MYRKIVANSAIYGVLPQLPKVASLFILPLITPFLSGVDYGVVGVLNSYVGALSVLHLLGLNLVVINSYYHHPTQYKWFWRQIYGFVWVWSFVFAAFLVCAIYFALPEEASHNKGMIIIMKVVPLLLFAPSDMFAGAYYRLQQKALPVAIRSLFAGIIAVFLTYYFIAVLKLGYMGWIASDCITALFSGVVFIIPVYRDWRIYPIFNFKWRLIKKALKVSLPVVPHYYSGYLLNSSDRLIMERLKVPTKDIGLYSLAYNFGNYVEVITNAINQALSPSLMELIKRKNWDEYEKIISVFQSIMLLGCLSVSLWVPQWLPLLVRNKELLQIQYLLIIIIMSYSYRPMYIGCNNVLFYFEKTNKLWRITFVAGIISVVANLIFIPFYGIAASAVVTFFSFLYMGFTGFLYKHYRELSGARLRPSFWFSGIIVCLVLVLVFYDFDMIYKFFINLFVLVALVIVNKSLLSIRK